MDLIFSPPFSYFHYLLAEQHVYLRWEKRALRWEKRKVAMGKKKSCVSSSFFSSEKTNRFGRENHDTDLHLPKYKRDLIVKLQSLRGDLNHLQPQSGHCRMEVCRESIFEESYRLVLKFRAKDLRKRLMVKFTGEDGIDYGGVTR